MSGAGDQLLSGAGANQSLNLWARILNLLSYGVGHMEQEKMVKMIIRAVVVLVIIGAVFVFYKAKQKQYVEAQQSLEMQMKAARK